MQPQVKEGQKSPEARGVKQWFTPEPSEEVKLYVNLTLAAKLILDFQPWELWESKFPLSQA
jgi:hypothetical protein